MGTPTRKPRLRSPIDRALDPRCKQRRIDLDPRWLLDAAETTALVSAWLLAAVIWSFVF